MDTNRPLSWSAISSFDYDKEQWRQKYVVHGKCTKIFCAIQGKPNRRCPVVETSPAMNFGKEVGDRIAQDPTYMPEFPRLSTFELKLEASWNGIPMIGYADMTDLPSFQLDENKTGVKKWDQKRVDKHGQIDMYLLFVFIIYKIRPEQMKVRLHWLPTTENADLSIRFRDTPPVVQTFHTKRTMRDILKFGQKIVDTHEAMRLYGKL